MLKQKFILLFLVLLSAFAVVMAQEDGPPPAFMTPITVDTGPEGMPLDAVMRSMVNGIGWAPLMRDVPEQNVVVRFKEMPFVDAWNLIFKLYASDLAYAALPGGVIVVGPRSVISGQFDNAIYSNLPPKNQRQEESKSSPEIRTVTLQTVNESSFSAAAKLFPQGVTYALFPEKKLLVIKASDEDYSVVENILVKSGLLRKPPSDNANNQPLPAVLSVPALPDDVLQTLNDVFPNLEMRYVPSSSKLVIKGGDEKTLAALRKMLDELLAPPPAPPKSEAEKEMQEAPKKQEQPIDKVYTLENISPENAARIIGFVAPTAKVLVVQGAANAIWVKAYPSVHDVIAKNLKHYEELAKQEAERKAKAAASAKSNQKEPEPVIEVEAFPVANGAVENLVKVLKETLEGATVVASDTGIVVKGPKSAIEEARKLINTLAPEEGQQGEPEGSQEEESALDVRKVYNTDYSNPSELLTLAESTGALPKGPKYIVDSRTTDIIVVGPEQDVNDAIALFRELDRPIPQVDLRVQIHQVDRSSAKRLGIDLNAILAPFSATYDGNGLQLAYELGSSALNAVTAALDTLESHGAADTLVDTRFLAQDGQTVSLKSGGKLTVLVPASSDGESSAKPLSADYGLEVKLTPEIALNDGQVTIDINTVLGGRPVAGAGGTIDIPRKEFTDYVRIKNGESVVLGGLLTTVDNSTESNSPLVSWIPLIGDLFTRTEHTNSTSELLIIVTAHIIYPEASVQVAEGEEVASEVSGGSEEAAETVEEATGNEQNTEAGAVKDEAQPTKVEEASNTPVTKEPEVDSVEPQETPSEEPTSSQVAATPASTTEATSTNPAADDKQAAEQSPATSNNDSGNVVIGAAPIPTPALPLPANTNVVIRRVPANDPTYGFSILLPSSAPRLCLVGVRIEDPAGNTIPGTLRTRMLDKGCIQPGSAGMGNITTKTPAQSIALIFSDSNGNLYLATAEVK